MTRRSIHLAVILILAPAALATDARRITIADAGDLVPARLTTSSISIDDPPAPRGVIPQMPGFPTLMGRHPNFAPTRGVVFADLDGDTDLELIASSTDARLYAWHHDGTPVAGFPVATTGFGQYAPSVGDLDDDGDPEIVLHTRGLTSGGRLYAFSHTGAVLPGFPKSFTNNNVEASPTLYDLDGDGQLEILSHERDYPLGFLHVIEHDGTEWGGNWPVQIDHVPTASAAVGDVDNDGQVEIFTMSYTTMYLLRTDGTLLPGWPRGIAGANFSYQSAALADLDGDGDLELIVGAHQSAAGCYVFHHDGTPAAGWPRLLGTWTYCPPTVTDLEGDGVLEILDGRAGFVSGPSDCFWAWTPTGQVKPGFPYSSAHGGGSEGPLTTADIDGDGLHEIFADHNITIDGLGFLFGVDAAGQDLPGFPLRPRGFTYLNSATIADVDNDGDYELGVLSSHDAGVDVNLYDLPDSYSVTGREWPIYHARRTRGGLYDPATPCPGDLDGDGDVDFDDLVTLLGAYGTSADGDVDGDGDTDFDDLVALLGAYGTSC